MIKVFNCSSKNYLNKLSSFLQKRRNKEKKNTKIVDKILRDIKNNKIKALLKYEKKFSQNTQIKPSKEKINSAIKMLDPKVKKAIDFAHERILRFHLKQKVKDITYIDRYYNKLEYKHVPIQSIGIYVPANLPSTLLMNAIPAKIANVKRIVLANPKSNGKLNSAVLYAAKKIGVKEIYSMGGAQAIGSLAYIQKVNKIVGPGNIYVAKAKREIFGEVGTEGMIAGPSEITILASSKTNIEEIITSLVGQAEHDVNSQCIVITKDNKLIKNINNTIPNFLKNLPRKNIAESSLKKNGLLIKVNNEKQITEVINEIAPEHLELMVKDPEPLLNQVRHAGAIFCGYWSAEALGDYCAGPNHVLPTAGTARFSSPLGVYDFQKRTSVIWCSPRGAEALSIVASTMAENEGLFAHARSAAYRGRRRLGQ